MVRDVWRKGARQRNRKRPNLLSTADMPPLRSRPGKAAKARLASIPKGSQSSRCSSNFPRIVRPVKEGLSLPSPAIQIAPGTMLLQLRTVTANGPPSFDLPQVIGMPAARVIAAIPLKPAARIVGMNPPLLAPHFEGLRSIDAEIVEAR